MTEALIREIATEFNLPDEQVVLEGLKAFLLRQLHSLEVERQSIFLKYQTDSLENMAELFANNPGAESDRLPDLQRADYLSFRIATVKKLLESLNGHD